MPYTSLVVREIALLCFPPEDAAFAEIARRLLAMAESVDPRAFEAILRARYAHAVVRPQEKLASFGGRAWYLYRDGRYSPFVDGHRWWDAPETARTILDGEGRTLDGNPAALQLLGVSLEQLRAASPGAFTTPEYRQVVPWILQLLIDTGELHSTSVVRPANGGPDVPVEFHLTRDGAGEGRHVAAMRAVPREAVERGTSIHS